MVLALAFAARTALASKPEKEGEHHPREIISDDGAPWSAARSTSAPIYYDPARLDSSPTTTASNPRSLIAPVASVPAGNGVVVAVFDVQNVAGQFPDKTIDQLTDYLAARLTEELGFRVVPREQVRARLLEQKAASFRPCFHESCQIELGKALAAKKALSTKLLRLGRTCALTSTLYDLKTETAEAAASTKSPCTESDLVTAVDRLTLELRRSSGHS
jgi:hypothetical protein